MYIVTVCLIDKIDGFNKGNDVMKKIQYVCLRFEVVQIIFAVFVSPARFVFDRNYEVWVV